VRRCCIQWKVFEVDRTNIFDRIIGAIGERIEPPKEGSAGASGHNGALAYWLTNTVTLLLLLQKNLKPAAHSRPRLAGAAGGGIAAAGAAPPQLRPVMSKHVVRFCHLQRQSDATPAFSACTERAPRLATCSMTCHPRTPPPAQAAARPSCAPRAAAGRCSAAAR
jgi:hypothetical protein